MGFDDIDLAGFAEPSLTTVAQDIVALGSWGVDRLLEAVVASTVPAAPAQFEPCVCRSTWSSARRPVRRQS